MNTKSVKLAVGIAIVPIMSMLGEARGSVIILQDDFNDNEVATPTYVRPSTSAWVVESGSFKADGTATTSTANANPVAGQLNFSPDEAKIHLDFRAQPLAGGVDLQFDLRQSNASTGYDLFWLYVEDVGVGSYGIRMSPNSIYFGTDPNQSGFYIGTPSVLGTVGAALNGDTSFQTLSLAMTDTSFVLSQDGTPVLTFNNSLGLTEVDRISLRHQDGGGISWFVDNVTLTGTVPEPSTALLLGLAGCWLLRARRRPAGKGKG